MSALDMSLDDVIKSKPAKQGGGGGGGRGGAGGGGAGGGGIGNNRGGKNRRRGGQKARGGQKDVAVRPAAVAKVAVSDGAPRRRLAVGVGMRPGLMASALKAAVAAAKATASPDGPKLPSVKRVPTVTGAAKPVVREARAAAPVSALQSQDKLQMSLDDVIKTDVKRKTPKSDKPAAPKKKGVEAPKAAAAGQKGQTAAGKRSGRRGGKRMRLRALRGTAEAAPTVKPQQMAKAQKGKGKGGGRKGFGDDRSWSKDWDDRTRGVFMDGGDGGRKRRLAAESWEPEKSRRVGSQSSFAWGGSNAARGGDRRGGSSAVPELRLQWEAERAERMARNQRLDRLERRGGEDRWIGGGGGMRSSDPAERGRGAWGKTQGREAVRDLPRETSSRAATLAPKSSGRSRGTAHKIRVSNVPKSLDEDDVREAFEDVGTVRSCLLERGVAVISFDSSAAAKKAVATFDRGELNGQTIFVAYEP